LDVDESDETGVVGSREVAEVLRLASCSRSDFRGDETGERALRYKVSCCAAHYDQISLLLQSDHLPVLSLKVLDRLLLHVLIPLPPRLLPTYQLLSISG